LGTVAFAATRPNGSACNPSGDSRIYGRDFTTGKSTLKSLVAGDPDPSIWVPTDGNVTDLRNLSVDGKGRLIACTDTGKCKNVDIETPSALSLRRLNWRELQVVD
jgi:type IV pilus assembly protein PilY1